MLMESNGDKLDQLKKRTVPDWFVALLLVFVSFFLNREAFSIYPVEDSLALVNANFTDFVNSLTSSWSFGGNLWRPLLVMSFAVDNFLFKDMYSYFYIQQLFLYGMVAFFIYRLSFRISGNQSFALLSGFIFILLPIHHENIYWLAGRGHLLSLCLMLFSLDLLTIETKNHRKLVKLAGYLSGSLSALAYESGFLLPVFLLVFWILLEKKIKKNTVINCIRESTIAFALFVLLFTVRWFVLGGIGGFEPNEDPNRIPLFTGFLENLFVDPYTNPILASVFHLILAIALIYSVIISIKNRHVNRLFFFIVIWLVSLLPFVFAGGFAPRFALTASISVALTLSAVLIYLYNAASSGPVLKIAALGLFSLIIISSFGERHKAIADWKRSGDIVRNLKNEIDRLEPRFTRPSQVIIGLPERVGKAYAVLNYLPYLMKAAEKGFEVKRYASFDNVSLEQFLLERGQNSQYWIFVQNKKADSYKAQLRELVKEPTRPDNLRFVFNNCKGQIEIENFVIQRKGLKGEYDFSHWNFEGDGKRLNQNKFVILKNDPFVLKAPASGGPVLKKLLSVTLDVKAENEKCQLFVMVDDKKSGDSFKERKFILDVGKKKNWRISGYHPAIGLWFNHLAAIEYLKDLNDALSIPADIENKIKFATQKNFDTNEYIEKLSFKAKAKPPAENALVNAQVYFADKQGESVLKTIQMTKPYTKEYYSTGLVNSFAVKKLIVGCSTNALEFSAQDFEVYRPVTLPEITLR